MRISFVLLFIAIILTGCNNKMRSIPSCLRQRIAAIQKEPRWNPPAEINEYQYKGKKVFLLSANCCDQYNMLVDEQCNTVCAPSGGITGQGDRKCLNFNDSAVHVRLIWKDNR